MAEDLQQFCLAVYVVVVTCSRTSALRCIFVEYGFFSV